MGKIVPKSKIQKEPWMRTYGELNLKKIREEADLDFAHFTYKRGMCSCCYGPADLPPKYWKDGVIRDDRDFEYILFKNADNGSGVVTKNDVIDNYTYVSYEIKTKEKLELVCHLLQEQLGDGYAVGVPQSTWYCISIFTKKFLNSIEGKSCKNDDNYLYLGKL